MCSRSATIIILMINIIHIRRTFSTHKLPLWTWDCIDEKCVPSKATQIENVQSLMTCNMLCSSLQLWPQPTGRVILSTSAIPVRAELFHLKILSYPSIPVREYLIDAFNMFRQDLYTIENNTRTSHWHAVEIQVAVNESGSADPRMLISTDESFQLQLRTNNEPGGTVIVDIASNSFCGARHALETVLQLVWLDPYVGSLFMIDAASVEDSPRFRYRGLMLDTARNYYSVNEILRTIDGMAACKLNTFHWHAIDSQGVSIQLESIPQSQYESNEDGLMYSLDEVRTIVNHARKRGIRVLLEVDLLTQVANIWEWLTGKVESTQFHTCNEQPFRITDLNNAKVHNLIKQIYSEIIQLTGVDDIIHLGGDNYGEQCRIDIQNVVEPVQLWMESSQSDLSRLEIIILWSTHLSDRIKINLNTYIDKLGTQVRNIAWGHQYISGVRTIISHEDAWDLNSGYGAWYEDTVGAPYNTWQRVYEHRPWARKTITCLEGGEATVWSSTLDSGGLDAIVWPRAAALGERLWSDYAEGATRLVQARLDMHRSRLVSRGIQAAPLWSMWCTHNAFTC